MYKIKKEHIGSFYNSNILNRMLEVKEENIRIIIRDCRYDLLESKKKPLKPVKKAATKPAAKTEEKPKEEGGK